MSKKQIPKKTSKRAPTLLTAEKDEELRPSLNPLTFAGGRSYSFTKFVKFKDKNSHKASDLGFPTNTKIKFSSQESQHISKQRTGSALYAQYRDKSFLVPDGPLSWDEQILYCWNFLFIFLLREKEDSDEPNKTIPKSSRLLLVWNLLVISCYIYNIYEVPVALFFTEAVYQTEVQTPLGLALNWIFITIILLNIIFVRPNSQFEKLGYLINNRMQIMQDYLGYKFLLDLIGVIILMIYVASGNPALIYLKIFFYSNLVTLMQIDQNVRDKLELHPYGYAVYRLIRLQFIIIFIVLWLSSIFFGIDYYFYRYGPWQGDYNWLTNEPCTTGYNPVTQQSFQVDVIAQYPWYIWLNYAAYWCLQTISTVGYGDFTPKNPPSVVFTNVTILMVVFFFVLFINSVIEIIDEMTTAQEKQRKTNLKMFKQYYLQSERKRNEISIRFGYDKETIQKNQKLAEITADNIRSFLYQMDLNNLLDEEDDVEKLVYNNLTEELREELFLNYRQQFFKKVLLFGEVSRNSNDFLEVYQQLIYKIKEVPYGSGQIVYADYENISHSLYFLLKGNVMLKYPLSKYTKLVENITEKSQQTGNYYQHRFLNFGVRQFFTRQPKDHLAVTMSYCKIQMLAYEDFLEIIKQEPAFYFKYCQLRDTITIFGNNRLTGEECFECHSKDHHLFSCPQCNYNIGLNTWRTIRSKGPIPKRGAVIPNEFHSRKPFLRDPVVCNKINTNRPLARKIFNVGKVYIFDDYFPDGNLKVQRRYDD